MVLEAVNKVINLENKNKSRMDGQDTKSSYPNKKSQSVAEFSDLSQFSGPIDWRRGWSLWEWSLEDLR